MESLANYDGGFIYIDTICGVSLTLDSVAISSHAKDGNGGILCISGSMTGDSYITLVGGTISSTYANNGGAFYIPSTAATSTITTSSSTTISNTYASNNGGVIYTAAANSNSISIS